MKKIFSLIMAVTLAFTMAFSLTSCGKDETVVSDSDSSPQTIAQKILVDFNNNVNGKDDVNLEELASKLLENESIKFVGTQMKIEPGLLSGFQSEITGFEEGVMFLPTIGSIPFVGYVFKLADGADINAFKKTLKENANLRWIICDEADEMLCESNGNYVLFLMSPLNFDDQ